MTVEATVQAVSIMVAILTFIIAQAVNRARNLHIANRETYQRLELASIGLFRFEADHVETIRPVWEESVPVPPEGSAEHFVVTDYVCQLLNLFEMAIRLRKERVVPPEVFGSWVVWYYDLANAAHFPTIWDRVMWNYTSDLRHIMNVGVRLATDEADDAVRRNKFFRYVADELKCPAIGQWLTRIETERAALATPPGGDGQRDPAVTIDWTTGGTGVSGLVEFMARNIDDVYISHGELQDGRATDHHHWSPRLRDVLAEELDSCVRGAPSPDAVGRLAVGRLSGVVVSVMMVEIHREASTPYAVLQDLVVERAHRGAGVGRCNLRWLERRLTEEGIGRLFLESGSKNRAAHRFFARNGFSRCSIVMFKDLPAATAHATLGAPSHQDASPGVGRLSAGRGRTRSDPSAGEQDGDPVAL